MFGKTLACVIVALFFGAGFGFAMSVDFYEENYPPEKPMIYGPDTGTVNVEYTFCTDTITDPEGDSLYCFWDWDDGNSSGWLGPFASGQVICASHMWTHPGVYCIILKLKDTSGIESESDPFCITIVENHPPSDPIIDGPTSCRMWVEYNWSFVSTDPDGDNITYYVDWSDKCGCGGFHGPYPSGEEVFLAHTYKIKTTLIINAMAIDEHGAESNVTYFDVTISLGKANNLIFMRLLEQFPNALLILRHLLGL